MIRPTILTALLALAPALTQAQEAPADTPPAETTAPAAEGQAPGGITNGQAFEDWQVSCQALGVDRTACMLTQTISRSEDRQLLAELIAFWSGDGARRFVGARVPVGAHLPSGFVLRVDEEEEQVELTWQSCNSNICEALAEIDQATFDRLTGATELLAGYRPAPGAEPLIFKVSNKGLSDGMTALGAPKE